MNDSPSIKTLTSFWDQNHHPGPDLTRTILSVVPSREACTVQPEQGTVYIILQFTSQCSLFYLWSFTDRSLLLQRAS